MSEALDAMASPYPGLRPFRQQEAAIFFGRTRQIAEMVFRLADRRFLAVVGASGCGKSSLVRAGLLPALEQGLLASTEEGDPWRMIVVRPGDAPLRNLAQELVACLRPDTQPAEKALQSAFVHAALRSGPRGLVNVIQEANLPDNAHVMILIDQFEELFRFRQQASEAGQDGAADVRPAHRAEAEEFVSLLLATAVQTERIIHVVITMRSDFIGDCDAFHGLPEAINDSQFLTPRLTRDQAEEAIVKPARLLGGNVEEALANRILNEIGNSPDQLPIMQHVLMRLWNQADAAAKANPDGQPIVLRLRQYEEIGGLAGALNKHAEEIYRGLSPIQQRLTEVLFRALSDRDRRSSGAAARDIRRPAKLQVVADIVKAEASLDQLKEVVDIFRQPGVNFLALGADVPLTPDTRLDVGHESLLRNWKLLSEEWLKNEAESAAIYRRLRETAQLKQEGKKEGFLDVGELRNLKAWVDKEKPTAAWATRYGDKFELAMEFLRQSEQDQERCERAAREAKDKEEAAVRAEQQRRESEVRREEHRKQKVKRYQAIAIAASVFLVVVSGLAIWAVTQTWTASQRAKDLVKLNKALGKKTTDLEELADVLKTQATELDKAQKKTRKEADSAAILNLAAQVGGQVRTDIIATPQRGVLLALATGQIANGADISDEARNAVETALRKSLSSIGGLPLFGEQGAVDRIAVSDEEGGKARWFVTSNKKDDLRLWNLGEVASPVPLDFDAHKQKPVLLSFDDGPPRRMEILRNKWLFVQGNSGKLLLWDLAQETPHAEPIVLNNLPTSVAPYVSPHKNLLRLRVVKKDLAVETIWDLDKADPSASPFVAEVDVTQHALTSFLSFTKDGRWLALIRSDGKPLFFDMAQKGKGKETYQFPPPALAGAPPMRVVNGEFTDDGRLIVSFDNGTIGVWTRSDKDKRWRVDPEVVRLPSEFLKNPDTEVDVFTDARGLWAVVVPKNVRRTAPSQRQTGFGSPVALNLSYDFAHQAELFDLSGKLTEPDSCRTLLYHFDDVDLRSQYPIRVAVSGAKRRLVTKVKETPGGANAAVYRILDLPRRDAADKIAEWSDRREAWEVRPLGVARTTTLPSGESARVSPDGHWFINASLTNYVQLWDFSVRRKKIGSPVYALLRGHDMNIADFQTSGDGRWLITLGMDNTVRYWDLENLSQSVEPREIRNPAGTRTIAITSQKDWLAVSRQDGTLRFWNVQKDVITSEPSKLPKGNFASLQRSEDGRWLLTYGEGADAVLWKLKTDGRPSRHCKLKAISGTIYRLLVDPTGKWVAATFEVPSSTPGSLNSQIRLWHVVDDLGPENREAEEVQLKNDAQAGVAHFFDAMGKRLVCETETQVESWDLGNLKDETRKRTVPLNLKADKAQKYTKTWTRPFIFADGQRAILFTDAGEARLFDLKQDNTPPPNTLAESNIFFRDGLFESAAGNWLVLREFDSFKLWNLSEPKRKPVVLPQSIAGESKRLTPRYLGVSPDRRWLLTVDNGKGVLVDLTAAPDENGNPKKNDVGTDIVTAAFNGDSLRLVTTEKDLIRVWDLKGDVIRSTDIFAKDNKGVFDKAVAVSSDGLWLAAAGRDYLIRVWDLRKTTAEAIALHGHPVFFPLEIFITPDGKKVISVDIEGEILRVSTVAASGLPALAERIVGRALTPEERKLYSIPGTVK